MINWIKLKLFAVTDLAKQLEQDFDAFGVVQNEIVKVHT